jgi:hypothetical protein
MKKILMTLVVCSFSFIGTLSFWADDAEAIPVFARKYGMACNSCHTMFPKLTKMGVAFRERGFRFAAGKDDLDSQDERGKNFDTGDESPAAVFAANFPFTVRTQVLYSGSGPIEHGGTVVMPGHRPGMLDGALYEDANGNWKSNPKIGFGEFGLISSGAYDNFSWWLDASLAGADSGIGMLEGIYYVNDLLKVRFGRIQNNVGYGMTMMSHRPLGWGWVDAAQMAGATMLMMTDGVSIHGTTNGDSGVGTSYTFSVGTSGRNFAQNNQISYNVYGRIAQEIMDDHIIGVFGYSATNYSSDAFGGEGAMLMAMDPLAGGGGVIAANPMQFSDVSRYGVDFAINYGEPIQAWGAVTYGRQTNLNGTKLNVRAATVSAEWKFADAWLVGAKFDYSKTDLQMMTAAVLRPQATTNITVFGIYQIVQNVQAIASFTNSRNVVNFMGMAAGITTVDQQKINTGLLAIDVAL